MKEPAPHTAHAADTPGQPATRRDQLAAARRELLQARTQDPRAARAGVAAVVELAGASRLAKAEEILASAVVDAMPELGEEMPVVLVRALANAPALARSRSDLHGLLREAAENCLSQVLLSAELPDPPPRPRTCRAWRPRPCTNDCVAG